MVGVTGSIPVTPTISLIFLAFRRGCVAQRESTAFTRQGSQVQSLSHPPFMSAANQAHGVAGLLPLFPPLTLPIALISPHAGERGQPGFAAEGPAFVGGEQLFGGVEGAEVHFDLVAGAGEDGGAAAGAEVAAGVGVGVAG